MQQHNPECIFCKIVEGKIPSSKLYEDEHILSFLDIGPVNKGHALIIPKKHFVDLTEIPEKELKELIKVSQKIAIAVEKATNAQGFNIAMNNKPAAGQVVMHAHLHVIPRYKDDGLKLWPQGKYAEGEMEEYRKKISKLIN
jgi:histidine triad (HIT) family protein